MDQKYFMLRVNRSFFMPKDKIRKNGHDAGHGSQDEQIKAALIQEINLALEGKSPDKLKEVYAALKLLFYKEIE